MADSVLYFPYVKMPSTDWFTRVLLYWDAVGRIVPPWNQPGYRDWDSDSEELPYSIKLSRARLLRDFELQDMIYGPDRLDSDPIDWRSLVERFRETFLSLIDADHELQRTTRSPDAPATTFALHTAKGRFWDVDIFADLEARTLAEREGDWCRVHKRAAALYMASLAALLGSVVDMDPITDDPYFLHIFSKTAEGEDLGRRVREEMLASVLPAPSGYVEPIEIARFKDRYNAELVRFRRRIERAVQGICLVGDESERAARLELIQGDLREEVAELAKRMEENGWRSLAWGTLAFVGATAPLAHAVTSGQIWPAVVSLPALALGARQAVWDLRHRAREQEHPLAYAALAERDFRPATASI